MKRAEEIRNSAFEYIKSDAVKAGEEYTSFGDFINGAEWADKHPHWISVDEELPKGFAIITNGDDVLVGKYNLEKGLWGVRNKTMFAYTLLPANWKVTHWMPLPAPPSCSEKPNNSKKGGKE